MTLEDVAGIDQPLRKLSKVVSYLRNQSFVCILGTHPPMGILLHAPPPGSGKTPIARTIAREAGHHDGPLGGEGDDAMTMMTTMIDCFAVCLGSKFVDTYVGRGALRVRGLFWNIREKAMQNFFWRRRTSGRGNGNIEGRGRKTGVFSHALSGISNGIAGVWEGTQLLVSLINTATGSSGEEDKDCHMQSTAIIFINEINCLVKWRDSGIGLSSFLGGGCDKREQTLNQLLTEMDGFDTGGLSSSS
jgi:ATP-dependent Zn protease